MIQVFRGVVGMWEEADGYRRTGEYPSHGIGPHELVMAPDGRTPIVANGGILTRPDSGRRKLNIPDTDPSLAYIDSRDGRLLERVGFTEPRHKLLSIRHLAVNAVGTVCVALQDQAPSASPAAVASRRLARPDSSSPPAAPVARCAQTEKRGRQTGSPRHFRCTGIGTTI